MKVRIGSGVARRRGVLATAVTGVLVCGTLFGAGAAMAAEVELVANGDFEAGSEGWSAEKGGTLQVIDDGYGDSQKSLAIVDRTATQSSPFYSVKGKIAEGDQLHISAKLKYEEGDATKGFNFTLCPNNFDGEICKVITSVTATKGQWASIEADFTATTDEWEWLFFENNWTNSPTAADIPDFVIDDVSLTVQRNTASLLPEGSFEDGFEGWSTDAEVVGREVGGTLSLDTTNPYEGDSSLKISGRENTWSGPHGKLTEEIQKGATYQFNAALRYDEGPENKTFVFTLCDEGFTGDGCSRVQEVTATKGQWTTFDAEWVAPQENYVWGVFEVPWKAAGEATADDLVDFQVDAVSLVKTKDAPEEPSAPGRLAVEDVLVKPVGDHNPINPWKFGADPHGLVWNGRLYVYATNDNQDYVDRDKDEYGYPTSDGQYNVTTLNIQSTTDMVNWVDHGEVPVAGSDGILPWAGRSWAPAAVAREVENPETGEMESKVFLYFCNGASGTAVLVGDSPLGPWRDVRSEAGYTGSERMLISQGNPIQFPDGMWLFDPEIFVDDDGQAYLYFGGNTIGDAPKHPRSTAVVKLRDNMYEVACGGAGEESCEDAVKFIDAPGMFEASSLIKHDGKYYYSYSANFSISYEEGKYPTAGSIPYMVSDDPLDFQPEHYKGVAFENPNSFFQDAGGNNHSDMIEYKGNAYFLYHSRTLGKAWKNGTDTNYQVWGNLRNTHVEEMSFNDDGTIEPIEGTLAGPEQIENFNPYGKIEAQTYAWQKGTYFDIQQGESSTVFPEHNNGGNVVLSRIHNNDWTGLSAVDFGDDGAASFTARVKALVEGAQIEVRLDDPENGPVVATLPVDSEIGQWTDLTSEVSGATGVHDVFFAFVGDSEDALLEADYWEFSPAGDTPSSFEGTLGASSVLAGGKVSVSGSGAQGVVTVTLDGTAVGSGESNDQGVYSFDVTVPAGTAAGEYTVTVSDESGSSWTASLRVLAVEEPGGDGGGQSSDGGGQQSSDGNTAPGKSTGGSNDLAQTGATAGLWALGAVVLLGSGIALAVIGKRRRP